MKTILEAVVSESKLFLEDEIKIDVLDIENVKEFEIGKYISSISLVDDTEFRVVITIEEKLFDFIFKSFFDEDEIASDKEELIAALPDEIINIVVGLAIKNFPVKHKDKKLSIPTIMQRA